MNWKLNKFTNLLQQDHAFFFLGLNNKQFQLLYKLFTTLEEKSKILYVSNSVFRMKEAKNFVIDKNTKRLDFISEGGGLLVTVSDFSLFKDVLQFFSKNNFLQIIGGFNVLLPFILVNRFFIKCNNELISFFKKVSLPRYLFLSTLQFILIFLRSFFVFYRVFVFGLFKQLLQLFKSFFFISSYAYSGSIVK